VSPGARQVERPGQSQFGLTARPIIRPRRWPHVVLLSVLLCLANVGKPLVVDDAAYYAYAAHIAENPFDPYGFTIFWYQNPQPAFDVLAPPVLCYWWAVGIRLFGDSPVLWKLWLWPWCVVFAAAVLELCRRFARPVAVPMAWFIVGSPTVLPALNLMLDIPALALSLAAIALFLRVSVTRQAGGAIAVGALTAAAMQTKYTALVTPAVLVMAAWTKPRRRRLRALGTAIVAVVVAAALFCAWESFVAWKYGSSHVLAHAGRASEPWRRKLLLFWPLIGILGGVGAPLVIVGLTALRFPRGAARLFIGLMAASWVTFGVLPAETHLRPGLGSSGWSVATLAFGWIGALALGAMAFAAVCPRDHRGRFLTAWWLLELFGFFLLSPWPAVRRVIGLCIVGTLVLARQVGPTPRSDARCLVRFAAAVSVAFGILFQVIDTSDALAERAAVEETARLISGEGPAAEVWFTGHFGMQFYAERAGWRPVVPDESRLSAGDWLVIPDRPYGRQAIDLPDAAHEVMTLDVSTPWPFDTIPAYYGGHQPIERSNGPTVRLLVYRLAAACTPQAARNFGDEFDLRRH
jgi:hypothetical protein